VGAEPNPWDASASGRFRTYLPRFRYAPEFTLRRVSLSSVSMSSGFVAGASTVGMFAIEERPRDPLSRPVPRVSQARSLRGLPELFAGGLGLYQTRQALCHRVAGSRHRRSLGEKAPNLKIGGKAPNMHLGGKAPRPRENTNMETIARTPLQLGNYIRQRRRELGLTQEKLAAKVGVRQRTVSDIETSAAVRFDTVLRTLAALDLELVIRPRTKGSARDIERLF
jgi:HTH-type transcriptional regulator/antitoxin HipB